MARFQKPPDPREPETALTGRRARHQRNDNREPIPWLWLLGGIFVSILGVFIAINIVTAFLTREPLAVTLPTPTIIRLTAPPSPIPTATQPRLTPTTIPTITPVPTINVFTPPPQITVGYYAQVADTGGVGVALRGGPGTANSRIVVIPEGEIVLVIGGPQASDELTWWQIRRQDGTEGWAAGQFFVPSGPSGQ